VPDELGQEEGGAGFHDQAAAREDEADFGGAVGEPDGHGQRHGDADADGGALERGDGGFAAVVDGEGYAAAADRGDSGQYVVEIYSLEGLLRVPVVRADVQSELVCNPPIPVIVHPFFLAAVESHLQIRARAEDPAVPCHDDAFDTVVDVEEREGLL